MSNRALLLAIAACCTVAACDKKDEPPKPKATQAVVPLPPEAPKAAAASANQDAKPMQVAATQQTGGAQQQTYPGVPYKDGKRGGCGKEKCKVRIDVSDTCTAAYNAEYLSVYAKTVKVSFHLTGGWKFQNNGIELPVGGNQFKDANDASSGPGKDKWIVEDQNSDNLPYKYTIRAEKGAKKCKIDPSMVNGAEYEDPNYPVFP